MLDNGKAKIDDTFNELKIEIPTRKNWFVITFIFIWMVGWYMGFTSAIGSFGENAFMTFWLIGWTVGGLSAAYFTLWSLFGKEIILIDYQYMTIEKSILGIGTKTRLEITEIRNVRYEFVDTSMFANRRNNMTSFGVGTGPIRIDYGLKTFSFGLSVDEAEANYIVELIRKKIKK